MRTLLVVAITWACALILVGCSDTESTGLAHAPEASSPPIVKGYTFTQAETAVMRMQIAHLITAGQIDAKLKTVNPTKLTANSIKELIVDPNSLVLLKGNIASYEDAPDGKSAYLYFAEEPKESEGQEELLSVAWLAVPRSTLKNNLNAGGDFDIVCRAKADVIDVARRTKVARFTNCVPLPLFNEMVLNAIAKAIAQQADHGEINGDVAPIVVRAINLAADKETMAECFADKNNEIENSSLTIACAQKADSYNATLAADTLRTKGLKISSEKSTGYGLGEQAAIFNTATPVEAELSYQMTDLEAKLFKAWLHNDIKNWIELSEAGEKTHPGTNYLSSYLGGLTLVSAEELEVAYYENEVAADLRFLEKRLLVHGKIGSINSGLNNKPSIGFSTGNRFQAPSASFKEPDLNAIAQLKRGQAIRLICMGAGEIVGSPRLNNCEFADDILERSLTEKVAQVRKVLLNEPRMLSDFDLALYTTSVVQARILPENSMCKSSEELGKCAASAVKTPRPQKEISQLRRQMIVRGAASAWPNDGL